jgi:hypothetical protein
MNRFNYRNNKSKAKGPGLRRVPRMNDVNHPPEFQSTVTFNKRLRFIASSAMVNVSITLEDLFDLLCVATSSTSAYQLATAIRLQVVEMWALNTSSDTSTVSVEYPSISNTPGAPTKVFSDTSVGQTFCAHVKAHTPALSNQSFWQCDNGGGQSFILLNGPTGTIVDIGLQYVLRNGEAVLAVGGPVSGATAGQLYCRALDSNGSGLLVPQSFVTI